MLASVCISNGISLGLMIILLVTNREHFSKENRIENLVKMIVTTMISCVLEIIGFAFDGSQGTVMTVILYLVNSWLFLSIIIISHFWTNLQYSCAGSIPSKLEKRLFAAVDSLGLIALIINVFKPIVFSLENNTYVRMGFYWLFALIGLIHFAFGIYIYYRAKNQGKPVVPYSFAVFIVPAIVGFGFQTAFYGVSLMWVGITLALAGVTSSLKNSLIFIDSLTHIYNAYYLQKVGKEFEVNPDIVLTGIMLDINDFKKINDTYGHNTGDEALVKSAEVFSNAVKGIGTAVRYGGDEFVILIYASDKNVISSVVEKINAGFDRINQTDNAPYKLSSSMGYSEFHAGSETFNEFLKALDSQMYLSKAEYHRENDEERQSIVKLGAFPISPEILNKANIGLWAAEIDDGEEPRMYINDTMLHLLELAEYLTPEMTYHAWFDNIDSDSYYLVAESFEKIISGEHAEVQYPWHSPNGQTLIARCGGIRNYDYKKGIRIEGTYQNVSDVVHFDESQKKQEIQELSLKLMSLLADSYYTLVYVDADTCEYQIISNDNSFSDSKDALLRNGIDFFADARNYLSSDIVEEDRCTAEILTSRETLEEALGDKNSVTVEYRVLVNGEPLWNRLKAVKSTDDKGNVIYAIGVKCIEEELEHQKQFNASVALAEQLNQMKSFGDMINAALWSAIINEKNEIVSILFSDEFRRMIGYEMTEEDFPNSAEAWASTIYDVDRVRTVNTFTEIKNSQEYENKIFNIEYRCVKKSGDVIWLHDACRVIDNGDGTRKIFGIVYDITTEKELDEQRQNLSDALTLAESANKAKSEFLYKISHGIRTPLNAALGYVNMAKHHINDKDKAEDYIDKTIQSGNNLVSILNTIVDMERIESEKIIQLEEIGDIYKTFDGVRKPMTELAADRQVELSFDIRDIEDRYVYADIDHCERVFTNLISNAIKYTPCCGKVAVTCTQIEAANNGYAKYRYTVADNGIGMSEEFQKRILTRFSKDVPYTLNGIDGSGLGLAVCTSFVDAMGGTIDCTSKIGEGTVFTVELPFRVYEGNGAPELTKKAKDNADVDFTGKTILLAEDNQLNAEITRELLSTKGFDVDIAEDGVIAVQKLREKGPDFYDAVLMDIQMPNMNGYEATREIRKMYPDRNIPIIALSANAFEEDISASKEAQMDDYLVKPVNIGSLVGALSKYI